MTTSGEDAARPTHQAKVEWMGTPVLTLRDLWPEQPRAVIVGLNPSLRSVEVGHYYQGRLGQRQLLYDTWRETVVPQVFR